MDFWLHSKEPGGEGKTLRLTPEELHRLALEWGLTEREYHDFRHRALAFAASQGLPEELALNIVTVAMCSVEWSEHCGYPRSRQWLKLLPRTGKYAPYSGEDVGGIHIGDGLTVVFKMESHNHPSAVEPYQGAATGIGGIVRDVLTVGARPIALLDSLRFGPLAEPRNRYLLNGVVAGIAGYGNCIGVPTVGGEVYFAESYSTNPLVNVMCIGVAPAGRLVTSRATGAGNAVMYVGSSTGRDGIGGASVLASHEFGESDEKRPTVQIGDPFTKKCLIEAFLEAIETGHVLAAKDMGAAGVTCTTCESCAAGGSGMDFDLSLIPRREEGMEPHEVMMSESQERMLLIVQKGQEETVAGVFRKWGLNAAVVGRVTDDGIMWIREKGELIAAIPARLLTEAPTYHLPAVRPAYLDSLPPISMEGIPEPPDYSHTLLQLLASPNIASRQSIYQQYDHMVQVNTLVLPGEGDAAVLRIKGTGKAIAATTDGNGRYCYLDPYLGGQIAVVEAARNLVCVGAEPAAVTDCLNFGNPDKPDRFWQFTQAVRGIADACRFLGIPVVSGNVSFYNESPRSAIYPTPVIGMVGLIDDQTRHCTTGFKDEGDIIVLMGSALESDLGGSEYLAAIHGLVTGKPPMLDLALEKRVQDCCLQAIRSSLLKSAHDCSDGGLGVALAESCIVGGLGATVQKAERVRRADVWLFHEGQSRIVVSVSPERYPALEQLAAEHGVELQRLGHVGGERLAIGHWIDIPVEEIASVWYGALAQAG